MISFLQLLGGLVLLIYAGDALIRGSVSISRRLEIPPMIVGLTVVAFGTSAPELMVAIDAVLTGYPTLALGNVVGSNIANIWLVLGLPALLAPFACTAPKSGRNFFAMMAATALFIAVAFTGAFTALNGLILLAGFFAFLFFQFRRERKKADYREILEELEGLPHKPDPTLHAILYIIAGLAGLTVGAHFFVLGAAQLASMLGVSEAVIGLTVVAVGTSIPELVTSIAASMKKHFDVAIGNVLGSNIFNLLAIIGISSMFGDIPVPKAFLTFDLWVMVVAALSFLPFIFLRKTLGRASGIFFCLAYVLYVIMVANGASGIEYHAAIPPAGAP